MAGLGDLFGRGSIAEQMFVWGILNQVISQIGSPYFAQLAYNVNQRHPVIEHTPEQLALMAVRNVRPTPAAAAEAKRAGLTAERFDELVAITGDAPAPVELAVALRRGLIPQHGSGPDAVSYDQGIREGRLKDKWLTMQRELAVEWPTPTDALEALLEGQISEAEARRLYALFGGNPDYFTMLFHTRGQAPTPTQALELLNRGIIPERGVGPDSVSYEQAFLEGPWRNKWLGPFLALRRYVPPPRTVTALLRNGSITPDRARELFRASGLTEQDTAAYIADATRHKAAAVRQLTEGQIVELFEAHAISHDEAVTLLGKLGLPAHDADLVLTAAGLRRETSQLTAAISKIRSSYLARHIDAVQARDALGHLGIASASSASMLRVWSTELDATPKTLTAAQIEGAIFYEIISVQEGLDLLVKLGYRRHDAWIAASVRAHRKLPGEPAR